MLAAFGIAASAAARSQSFYMNIYANEDCNSYKSTQQLGSGINGPACVNIDWAESWAVDMTGTAESNFCVVTTYENEDCSGQITAFTFNDYSNARSGCQDSSVGVVSR